MAIHGQWLKTNAYLEKKIIKEAVHKYFQVGTIRRISHLRNDVVEFIHAICSDDYFDAI